MASVLASCGGDAGSNPASPPAGTALRLIIVGLPTLDPLAEGHYQVWGESAVGTMRSLGSFATLDGGAVTLEQLASDVVSLVVTWERARDSDPGPSPHHILRGSVSSGRLSVVGAVTQGTRDLHRAPGQFTMFSPSDNAEHGYPSFEESGVWLFNMAPRQLPQNDMWVRLTQLQPGWVYEGWMVRDLGEPSELWLSYGKFTPDATGAVNTRDDTGWGPYSGVVDYRTAGEEEFPGDDWIANPLGLPLPSGVTLPLNLRERSAGGTLRWTHVITIEPSSDRGEAVSKERPFVLRPYRDPFGDGGPGIARTITFRGDAMPSGTVNRR